MYCPPAAFSLQLIEQFLRDSTLTIGAAEFDVGEIWSVILGVIFILSVLVFPQGIVGAWFAKGLNTREGWKRLFRRR